MNSFLRKLRWFASGVAIVAVPGILVVVFHREARRDTSDLSYFDGRSFTLLDVPHSRGAIAVNGDFTKAAWLSPVARTGMLTAPFGTDAGHASDIEITWDESNLYLLLRANDDDIRAPDTHPDAPVWREDSFHLFFGNARTEVEMDISPRGVVADARRGRADNARTGLAPLDYAWSSGVRVGVDIVGTLDDPTDRDETWILEVAIPLQSLGLDGVVGEHLAFRAHRCDQPKGSPRSCASWGEGATEGVIVLGP